MQNRVKTLINEMDVMGDRETALETAQEIAGLGDGALALLVQLGFDVLEGEADVKIRKKRLRAVILSFSAFANQSKPFFASPLKQSGAVDLLCRLSFQGFASATQLLHRLGHTDSDILKSILMSLPMVEKGARDREISLNEAVEEIHLARALSGEQSIRNHSFFLGSDGRHSHEIRRTGKKLFSCHIRKTK